VIIISQEYAWIPHPRTRECGAQTSILVHTIPWNVSNIFGPTGHPAPPLSPAVAEYCGVARGQQASAGNRISAASSRKRKHSVALVSAEAQHTSLGVRANLLHPVTQYSGTDTRSVYATSDRHSQFLTFRTRVELNAQHYGCHDWLWPHHVESSVPLWQPSSRTGGTDQRHKRLCTDQAG